MVTRLLRPDEKWRGEKVMAAAFEWGYDEAKAKAEAVREKTEAELKDQERNRSFGSFSDDEKIMYGFLNSRRYTCRFDGGTYLLGGVGGVATLPPYRRKGAIRACMTEALHDMYANDFTFSYLYPFSTQYYRKFGFEVAAQVNRWTLPIQDITPRDVGGTIEEIFPGDDMTSLLEVYNTCFKDVNLSAIREKFDPELEKSNFVDKMQYVYIWRNNAGEPRGLMISRKVNTPEGTILDCTTSFEGKGAFLFVDAEALNGLLYFVKYAFPAYYNKIRFHARRDIPLTSLVGENNTAECQSSWNGMLRVVNVKRVLENCKCRGEGSVKIKITDTIIPENTGVWQLTFAPNQVNLVQRTEEEPDISMSINSFSALISGVRGAEDIPWMPDVCVLRTGAAFENVFYQKKCFMMDLF